MDTILLSTVAQLSDHDLLARVKHLAGEEREVIAILIAHLAEVDKRHLYLAEGCASLFTYCTQILHLSEPAAYGRIWAARTSRRFPVILDMLSDGSVNLTTVCLVARHLTAENHREVLNLAKPKTKRQVLELVARLQPQPPVPDVIRKLPTQVPAGHTPTSSSAAPESPVYQLDGDTQTLLVSGRSTKEIVPSPARRAIVTPLAPQQYKVHL